MCTSRLSRKEAIAASKEMWDEKFVFRKEFIKSMESYTNIFNAAEKSLPELKLKYKWSKEFSMSVSELPYKEAIAISKEIWDKRFDFSADFRKSMASYSEMLGASMLGTLTKPLPKEVTEGYPVYRPDLHGWLSDAMDETFV